MRMMREGMQNIKNSNKPNESPEEKALHRRARYIDTKWDQLNEVSRAVSRRRLFPLVSDWGRKG